MFKLIRVSKEIIKLRGIKAYLLAVKEYLKRFFIITPIFGIVSYEIKKRTSSSPLLIIEAQGSKMMVNLKKKGTDRDLIIHNGLREPECTRIFRKELKEGMRVIDIGANIGYYVLQEAKIIGRRGKVYAIEPEPRNFEILKKNISLNNYSDLIEMYQVALGNKTGKSPFYISENSNWHTLSKLRENRRFKIINQIEVEVLTLDNFMADKGSIDFIRMDVEGFECFIIKGAKNLLSGNQPLKIYMEVHTPFIRENGESPEEMFKLLSDWGFNINYLVKRTLNLSFSAIRRRLREGPIVFSEKCIEYRKPLKKILQKPKTRDILVNESFYSVFLEK